MDVSGLILAGGRASRMGGEDKGLVPVAGAPMIAHVLQRLRPQVGTLAINANRHHAAYESFGYPVLADEIADYAGPLAGMLAGLVWAPSEYVQVVPCDGPLIAEDLVSRLRAGIGNGDVAVVHDGVRLQPTHLLIATHRVAHLGAFLADGGRKIDRWLAQLDCRQVDFSDRAAMFRNVNTPEERDAMSVTLQNLTAETAHDPSG